MQIGFRTTCGGDYGWGHWVRTLNLVEEVQVRGSHDITLIYDGPGLAVALAEKRLRSCNNVEFVQLAKSPQTDPTKLIDLDGKLPDTEAFFDVVFMDRLDYECRHLELWKGKSGRLAVFDDMGQLTEGADVIIRPQWLLESQIATTEGELLYGPNYFPVAKEWVELRQHYEFDAATKLVVCLGGGTTNRQGYLLVAEALKQTPRIDRQNIAFALGYELSQGELANCIRGLLGDVEIVSGVGLAKVMKQARLAVIGGGFLKYELAAAGVPSLILSGPDHQATLARAFAKQGCGLYAGAIGSVDAKTLSEQLSRLWDDRVTSKQLSTTAKTQVDGLGANRLCNSLFSHLPRRQHTS
jgi:spore coat polysaccharide biosynthesis predicted glycosyltransferase SpsG